MKHLTTNAESDGLRRRAAEILGWTFEDTCSFDLPTLATFVRERSQKLHDEIRQVVRSGRHIRSDSP